MLRYKLEYYNHRYTHRRYIFFPFTYFNNSQIDKNYLPYKLIYRNKYEGVDFCEKKSSLLNLKFFKDIFNSSFYIIKFNYMSNFYDDMHISVICIFYHHFLTKNNLCILKKSFG